MNGYRVVSIDERVAAWVRERLNDPQYGHPAHVEVAKGYGPCRQCLRKFVAGAERRVLFTYNPFEGLEPYPAPGPVFVHQKACRTYEHPSKFPGELRDLPLTFEGFAKGRRLLHEERTAEPSAVDVAIERLLERKDVDYIHVRNTEAGCFMMRLEREPASAS